MAMDAVIAVACHAVLCCALAALCHAFVAVKLVLNQWKTTHPLQTLLLRPSTPKNNRSGLLRSFTCSRFTPVCPHRRYTGSL